MTFSYENLQTLMDAANLTGPDLVRALDVSLASVNHWMEGKFQPSLDTVFKMAEFFAVPMDYLCGRLTPEQYDDIVKNYDKKFMELRRAPWEKYISTGRKDRDLERVSDYTSYEAPYPYNLLEDIFSEWNDLLNADQEKGFKIALSELTEREQLCIKLYYEEGKTLDEVGAMCSVTRERVRQIIAKALRKLRHPPRAKKIRYGYRISLKMREVEQRARWLSIDEYELDRLETKLETRRALLEQEAEELNATHLTPENENKMSEDFIDVLDLSVRSYKCLLRANCNTVGKLCKILDDDPEKLLQVRNLGRRSQAEIIRRVNTYCGTSYSV